MSHGLGIDMRHHGVGQIGGNDGTARAYGVGRPKSNETGAACHIEYALTRFQRSELEQTRLCRRELLGPIALVKR